MLDFEKYFRKYWMELKTPDSFSVFGLRHRTNNSSESFHSSMTRTLVAHPAFWRFLDDMVRHVVGPTELIVQQIDAGNQPRELPRRARMVVVEKQAGYEAKLLNNEWTPTQFLSASAYLFEGLKVPTDAQVAEFEADMAEILSDDSDDEDDVNDDVQAAVGPAPDVDNANANRCKVCLVNSQQVCTLPCRHVVMCQECDSNLQDRRCVYCRTPIAETIIVFIG